MAFKVYGYACLCAFVIFAASHVNGENTAGGVASVGSSATTSQDASAATQTVAENDASAVDKSATTAPNQQPGAVPVNSAKVNAESPGQTPGQASGQPPEQAAGQAPEQSAGQAEGQAPSESAAEQNPATPVEATDPIAATDTAEQQSSGGIAEQPRDAAEQSTATNPLQANSETVTQVIPPESSPTPEIEAPSYTKLVPVLGWNRHMSDSASTIKQWMRWWKYLNLKSPVIMPWIDGLNLRIYPGNEVYRAMFVKGIYDPNFSIAINSTLTKGGTFIDVGANIGNYSLLASKAVGESGRIFAIEPSSRDFNRLVDNIRLNHLDHIISSSRVAISDVAGAKATLNIASEERSGLNTFGTEFSVKGITKEKTESVDTDTLDGIVQKNALSNVEVIKIDIEGSEMKALHGCEETITKFRPVMMVGVNETALKASGTTREEVQKFMKDHRYRMYKVSYEPRFAFVPIDDISKTHAKVLFCFHESVIPPELPQPEQKSIVTYISDFFSK